MTTDDPAAAALHRLEQAMDTANDLIGGLIRRLDDSGRPRLRVVSGRREATVVVSDETAPPQLRIVDDPSEH
ncbi:MAG TPA: hypothetical protein VGP96_13970 [Candidatus Dormibacteraeota bacterium]|jgi:hypothetical protein|nr:hypothetical protein [Candidatus Dormibacteraeota bacterium]